MFGFGKTIKSIFSHSLVNNLVCCFARLKTSRVFVLKNFKNLL